MTMRAEIDGEAVAEATKEELARIEGNWYFPPAAIRDGALSESPTPYTCPWKGTAQYFDVTVGDRVVADGAWSYPTPHASAIDRVGTDFSGFVAFGAGIRVVGS